MKSINYFPFCPICGAARQKEIFLYHSFRYVRCLKCSVIWMNPQLRSEAPADDYEFLDWNVYHRFIADFRYQQFEKDIALIKKFSPPKGRLLDIGTGTGEFLSVASKYGFTALGIEPSKKASDEASKLGHVLQGEFEALSLKENFFEVITLWSVLEHVTEPVDFLHKASHLLKKNGLLALRVPLSSSLISFLSLWAYKLSGHKIDWPLRHFYQLDWHSRHFFLFSESSLCHLLKETGFQPLWMKRECGFDVPTLKYRLTIRPGNWLLEKILTVLSAQVILLASLLKSEDELVLLARKI